MSAHSDSLYPLRRLAARWTGAGPTSIVAFRELATPSDRALVHGVYGHDALSGVVCEEPGEAVRYRAPEHLLGPATDRTPLATGYRWDALAPARTKSLFVLNDAGVISNQGLVYCRRTRRAIAETAALWLAPASRHPLLAAPRFPAPVTLRGVSFSLLVRSSESFFHFLHEALPKLHLLGARISDVDHFIVNGPPESFARAWLERAGVPLEKVIWAAPLTHFACEQLLFTNDLCHHQQPTPWNLRALRATVKVTPPARPGRRLLWLSRKGAYARQVAWEESLARQFPQLEIIDLGTLSPAQQIARCAEAAMLLGPHGAGFSAIAFCAPGTRQVEFFPGEPIEPLYSRLAGIAGARAFWAQVDFDATALADPVVSALRQLIGETLPT